MSSGGRRENAGRKPKSMAEKIFEGKVDMPMEEIVVKEELPVLIDEEMPTVREYMEMMQQDGTYLEVKRELSDMKTYLQRMGCLSIVPPQLIEQFAMDRARWIALQNAVSKFGYVTKKASNGNYQMSPFQTALLEVQKNMNATYQSIRDIVKDRLPIIQEYKGGSTMNEILSTMPEDD